MVVPAALGPLCRDAGGVDDPGARAYALGYDRLDMAFVFFDDVDPDVVARGTA